MWDEAKTEFLGEDSSTRKFGSALMPSSDASTTTGSTADDGGVFHDIVPPHNIATDRSSYIPFIRSSEVAQEIPKEIPDGISKNKLLEVVPEEEKRPLHDTKILSGVEESFCQHASVTVFNSQGDGFDNIHRMVEIEKFKKKELVAVKDEKIRSLEEEIKLMEEEKNEEKNKYEDEIEKKEADLKYCEKHIAQKGKEINSLKEKHEKTIKELHQEYQQNIETLKNDQADLNESNRQRIRELEQELEKSEIEKNASELQKNKAEEKVEALNKYYEKIIQDENQKHAEEIKKLEDDIEKKKTDARNKEDHLKLLHENLTLKLEHEYRDRIDNLNQEISTLKQERTEAEAHAKVCEAEIRKQEAEMKAQMTAQEMEMKAEMKVQEAELNAQIEIHKSRSENQLALRMQAQAHAQEKQEILLKTKFFYESQHSLPSGARESYSKSLSMMQQMSITTSSDSGFSVNDADDSMQQFSESEMEYIIP